MIASRRQFALTLAASASGLLLRAAPAAAQDDDGLPNVFFSPPGQPFRRPPGAPYPVVDWFKQADKNGDGKLDHAEFMADADAFFTVLDLNGDGVLDGYEVQVYERRVAPEILGFRVPATAALAPRRAPLWGATLWRAQEPSGDRQPHDPVVPKGLDDSNEGAAPFNFFAAPEPITAADSEFRGRIVKANYLKLAERHFRELDTSGQGFLSLGALPKTKAQIAIEKRGRRRS
jgi:hypothetical protein